MNIFPSEAYEPWYISPKHDRNNLSQTLYSNEDNIQMKPFHAPEIKLMNRRLNQVIVCLQIFYKISLTGAVIEIFYRAKYMKPFNFMMIGK